MTTTRLPTPACLDATESRHLRSSVSAAGTAGDRKPSFSASLLTELDSLYLSTACAAGLLTIALLLG